ncbi:hypothetical protein [Psychrobacillus sp. L3]|uniref:hypothetical protein n=1 Tax=Psychrobacillus sp. L3 TaxID=3236891 RepID=UPI0036F22A09
MKNIMLIVFFLVLLSGCPDGEIELVNVVMINDIKYEHHFPNSADVMIPLVKEKGSDIGKVLIRWQIVREPLLNL